MKDGGNMTFCDNDTGPGNFTNDASELYKAPLKLKIIVMILFGVVLAVGIVGNLIVLFLIALEKSLHTTVNRCLFVLAVADLLILVFLPIQPILEEFSDDHSFLGSPLCHFLNTYDRGAVVCSALIFFFLSVDRYFAICHPLKIRGIWSGKNTNVALVVIWILSIASSIPYFYTSAYEEYKEGNTTYYFCYLAIDEPWEINYDAAMSIIIFFIPIPFLIFLYGRMIGVLRRASPGETTEEGNSSSGRRGRLQVVVMLMSVVTIFIVCQVPFSIVILLYSFSTDEFILGDPGGQLTFLLTWIFRILIYVNSAANPIVYFSVSSKFRQAFVNVFSCRRRSKSDHSRSTGEHQTVSSTLN